MSTQFEGVPNGGLAPRIHCKGCGHPLLLENLLCEDGCPCNTPRGVNYQPKPCGICNDGCTRPGHHLEDVIGINPFAELLIAARRYIEESAQQSGYGFYRPANPHDFSPDGESCTDEEMSAHKAACEAYDAGNYRDDYADGWITPDLHITKAPWGVGMYSYVDERAQELIKRIGRHTK